MPGGYEQRTSTQMAWLAGAAGLLVLLLVGGGWLVWRGVSTTAPRLDAPPSTGPTVAIDQDDVAFGAPAVIDGVPWTFPLTPQGAAAAASTAVAVTGHADVVFDGERFEQVAAVVFTPDQAEEQAREVEAARTQFELSGWANQPASRRLYFFTPLAVHLTSFDEAAPSAVVEVWSMSLVGVGDTGGAVFTTSTVTLAPDGTGRTWTVTGLESAPGPTPMVHDVASAPGRTRLLLRDALSTWPLPLPAGAIP